MVTTVLARAAAPRNRNAQRNVIARWFVGGTVDAKMQVHPMAIAL